MKRTCLSLAALLLASSATLLAAETPKPNILIILADDMGFSDASCYGGEIATPNLDALARDGLRFTQFYNTARCWPSRASILAGYYAQQVRRDTVPGVKSGITGVRPPWAPLLPEMLKPLGYRSYHSGKWHVDGKPLQNGFDHSYVLEDHDRHFSPLRHTDDDKPLPPVAADSGYYTSTAIADHAIRCLKEHAVEYSSQPFFAYVAFTSPHFPLQAPAGDIERYRDTYLRGWDTMRDERWQRMRNLGIGGSALSAIERDLGPPYAFPEDIKKLGPNELNRPLQWNTLNTTQQEFQAGKMAIHAAMVDRMDREIGRILAQLRTMGAMENTLVFFLSDNGASAETMVRGDGHDPKAPLGSGATFLSLGPGWSSMANTPFRRHKTWVHEGGIATPLIVHWARGIAARGELRHTPGHIIDIVPTILEVAGGKRSETWGDGQPVPPAPGKSLVPLYTKDGAVTHESLWWLHEDNRALRLGDWKIVAAGKDIAWELYDLRTDRSESKNLASANPEKVHELAEEWTRQMEEYSALARKDLPPATNKNLPSHRLNIIFLMDDQHRWDAIGRIDPTVKTPTLDRLAKDGILFDQAVCQAPMCIPSRYSMMLGLYPHQLGILSNGPGLSDEQLPCDPLPELLRKAGYQTAGFGKTHWLARGASTRGFEVRYSSTDAEQGVISMRQDNPTGLQRYNAETKAYGAGEENNAGYLGCTSQVPEEDHRDGWTLNRCLEFLDKGLDEKRPLFLYLSFIKPHAAHNVPAGFEEIYDLNAMPVPEQPLLEQVEPCHATGTNREKMYRPFWSQATRPQWQQMILRYRANCSWIDSMFGRVMNKLRAKGLLENCLIVYTSDHGEMLGERYYRFNKYCLFEHSVRVPLILAGTAISKDKKGTMDHRPAELVDIFPTILELAGVPKISGKPGEDLLGPSSRKAGFCEFNDQPTMVSFMWRTSDSKLILTFPKDCLQKGVVQLRDATAGELYDLKTDAREWTNLYTRAEYRAERERMIEELIAHLNGVALKKVNRSK